jgi:glyoxylase-like metal-dependent hydrolase (beta-lactamase superfamily II)
MGDDFFVARFPFVDLESGGSVQGLTRNIGEIIPKLAADVKIIPGHGPLSTVEDLKQYHHMLRETTAVVQSKMKAGKTVAQIKAEGLPAEWASWGSGFIKTDVWLETIHRSLSKK